MTYNGARGIEHRHPSAGQLALPFLTAEYAAAIDAAREVVDRQQAKALMARRVVEAAELARLGGQLVAMLEANAAAARNCR